MSIFPTDGERLKSLRAEMKRLKEAYSMLLKDRDTWKSSYEWMKQGCFAASEIIEKLKAEIKQKDEALRMAIDWYEDFIPEIVHISEEWYWKAREALTKPEEER